MGQKFRFGILLVSCIIVLISAADDDEGCRPGLVRNLRLNGTSHLTWDPPINENCIIERYLILITILGTDEEWSYTVTDRILDVGHLTSCLRYYFQVSQVSVDNVTGSFTTMNVVTPPPSDANLALDSVRLIPQGRNVRLEWTLEDQYAACAQRYRTVIANDNTGSSSDIYTSSPSVTIVGLTPCGSYTFSIRALFTLVEEGPATVLRHVAPSAHTTRPTLKGLVLQSTGAYLALGLQTLEQNRCNLNAVLVNSSPYFNSTFPVRDQENRDTFVVRLTGLVPDTLYYLRIAANNTSGFSDPLMLAVQTLPDEST